MVGAGEADALALAERIRSAVGGARACDGLGMTGGLPIALSAGVAAATAPADGDRLLAAADAALYGAKRAGRDRAVVLCAGDAAVRG
jgi:GGDEF domain-containing protein